MNTKIATKKFSYTGTGSTVEEVFAQVPLPKSQLEKLKQRSGMLTTEEALQTAVNHYLGCPEISTNSISGSARGEREGEKEMGILSQGKRSDF